MKALAVWLLVLFFLGVYGKTKWHQLENYTFDHYVREFKREYAPGSDEFHLRKDIFQRRLASIKAHNSDTTKTWKQGVNEFTDKSEEEFRRRLGLRRELINPNTHFDLSKAINLRIHDQIPAEKDWRRDNIISSVKNQGDCGSCWTFATAETIESYWAQATKQLNVLSEQQILDCTPNPNECGGTGGCGGGTAELAMSQLIKDGGLTSEWYYPYQSFYGDNFKCHFNASITKPFAKLTNYTKLPSNVMEPVLEHIAHNGPLAVSVAAGSWATYETGVYNGCDQENPILDHLVQLVGYGTTKDEGDYWLIRNSWSPAWGEEGYIRLKRHSPGNTPCGIDNKPLSGDGCKGGPETVKVCGTCGVLYDAVFPHVEAEKL